MARSNTSFMGWGVIAAALAIGVKFSDEILEQWEKLTAKKA